MAFKRVVVLGGGPIGLFCAIEAAEQFNSMFSKVTLVEMRQGYSRMNVPTLVNPIRNHLDKLGIKVVALGKADASPLAQVETALSQKARGVGVRMREGFVATHIAGGDRRKDGRFKDMAITIAGWDHVNRTTTTKREVFNADLLVLAVGASGIESDLFKRTLGFEQKVLKAESFAVYGVYDKIPHGGVKLDVKLQKAVADMGKYTRIETDNTQYLLLTLKDVSPSDFARLKSSSAELRRCMVAVGAGFNNELLGQINANSKAVGAFEVKIKRAGHAISPTFPAILVGDSAVSPHPQTGSGIGTGFHGFEAFQELLKALKATNRSTDAAVDALCAFEDSYEIYIAAKALEGTIVTLDHLIELVAGYEKACDRNFAATKGVDAKMLIRYNAMGAGLLRMEMESQRNRARLFGRLLRDDVVRLDNNAGRVPRGMGDLSVSLAGRDSEATGSLQGNDSIDRLWRDIGNTYQQMNDMLRRYAPLEDALRSIEADMRSKGVKVG